MITRDSIHVLGVEASAPNLGGRPKVPEPGVPVSSWVTPTDYDQLAKAARARGISISAFVRATLRAALRR